MPAAPHLAGHRPGLSVVRALVAGSGPEPIESVPKAGPVSKAEPKGGPEPKAGPVTVWLPVAGLMTPVM